jgi:hypothetical protein
LLFAHFATFSSIKKFTADIQRANGIPDQVHAGVRGNASHLAANTVN